MLTPAILLAVVMACGSPVLPPPTATAIRIELCAALHTVHVQRTELIAAFEAAFAGNWRVAMAAGSTLRDEAVSLQRSLPPVESLAADDQRILIGVIAEAIQVASGTTYLDTAGAPLELAADAQEAFAVYDRVFADRDALAGPLCPATPLPIERLRLPTSGHRQGEST